MDKNRIIYTLANNVKTIITPIQSHVSHICIYINSGSRDESDKNSGAMHLIEHMLFKGTSNRTYLEILHYIESVGGEINAFTSKEDTCVYISIHNAYIERAVKILSDIFYASIFPEFELEKEKDVVLDEILSYQDTPQENIFDEFEELFFEPHELSRNILGNKKSVQNITKKTLHDIYTENYITDNLIISYVGGVKPSEIISLTEMYFTDKKNSIHFQKHKRNTYTENNNFKTIITKNTYQAHAILGASAPHITSTYKTAMSLFTNLTGGMSFSSQLNLLLREQNGIAYNIECNYIPYSDTGIFFIYFGTDKSKIPEAKNIIHDYIQNIINHGISEDLLSMYKKQLIGQIALSFDNHVSLMISQAKSYSIYKHIDTLSEIEHKINSVSHEDIHTILNTYINPRNLSELIYL
ncbi:MAG: pitrilysin family protein [Bacteroidales bacterium]